MKLFEGKASTEISEREQMMLNVTCSSVYWKLQTHSVIQIQFWKFKRIQIGKIHVSQLYNSAI